ncbi:AAA family ATPase [Alteromonas aestuariivivens]|uniref:AAA family ATPase n=1 Tax=Alteromonas aestuariivivens TaxID=1938339 RepID=A0A3D8M624_9ALTE|nr:FimV/HubP family polar landmark protein [Alteromonas aestuariivivens]RDV24612.1 AAA family ATPase [Alteromonas aestuariivivens]
MKLHLTGLLLLLLISSAPLSDVFAQERVTQLKGPKNATSQYSGSVYGPIDSSDTLWRIANRYRQNKSLTVYQVMVAIYELNPDSFEQSNLNLLVDGATLKLPSERYIARIDAQKARMRADQDDAAFARMQGIPGDSLNNIKPPVPLVNQEDLSNTKTAIEQQITRLDSQQAEKFDELRQQFAASLDNVEILLSENRKLYERVEQVNTDLMNLKQQVEGDVQSQMDEQLMLQHQLLDMIKQEQAQRQSEQQRSLVSVLTQPISLIIGSGVITLLVIGGLAAWLLKRKPASNATQPSGAASSQEPEAPTRPKVEDLATSVGAGLTEEDDFSDDELFNDNDLLDDVLSTELEEALDDELENFADLDDDMLVPEDELSDLDDEFESGSGELGQDELDNLFEQDIASESLASEDEDEFNGFDLASDDEFELDEVDSPDSGADALETQQEPELSNLSVDQDDEFASVGLQTDEELQSSVPGDDEPARDAVQNEPMKNVAHEDDKPEITIDELLAEQEQPTLADTLGMDDDSVNEEMLERLDREIHQQGQELDRLTDNILGEIEQLEMMGGMMPDDDPEDEPPITSKSSPSPQAIQDLDAVAEELDEIDIEDMSNAEDFSDPLSDELIAELQADIPQEDEQQAPDVVDTTELDIGLDGHSEPLTDSEVLSDELLAELSAEEQAGTDKLDALSDELLAELEGDTDLTPSSEEDEAVSELATDEQNINEPVLPEPDDESPADPLEDALKAFDEQMMEEIPSFTAENSEEIAQSGFDDDLLNQSFDELEAGADETGQEIEAFSLEQEVDGVERQPYSQASDDDINELEDVPGLGDWLNDAKSGDDSAILDELEHSEFDDLLHAIDSEDVASEQQSALKLDNPDLDLEALLREEDEVSGTEATSESDEHYVDVETLIDDSLDGEGEGFEETPLDLDVSLSDFTGVHDDDDMIDIDKDAGQSANLDLARVYIEMDDIAAARELLEEVMLKGSEENKEEAHLLLKQLAEAS